MIVRSSCSRIVRVGNLLLIHVLLLMSPFLFALLLLKSKALVLELHLLQLLLALVSHLVLQHAAHAVHGQGLLSVSPIQR